jgi:DNA repair protein RecO (recombination protein O)
LSIGMRVPLQPGFLLHARPYRDSSQLLEMFTAEFGVVGLVGRRVHGRARGGSLRALLQPFRPLLLTYAGRGDLMTLLSVEAAAPGAVLQGERLFSGLYLNELLYRLLHRHDPHPTLFAHYGEALAALARGAAVDTVLRGFELRLLEELGYGFDPAQDAHTQRRVRENAWYRYSEGFGLVECPADVEAPGGRFQGADLVAIAAGDFSGAAAHTAKRLLRQVIAEHLAGKPLHTRELFRQYRRGGGPGEAAS